MDYAGTRPPDTVADEAERHVTVLFQAHALSLARLALLMLGDQAEAQDVVDEIRDALREAGRLREVRPLRLEPAPYRRAASARPRRALLRWAWLAPVTAAALVIAVAIALATVRTQQNGPAVPALPQSSAARTTVPEYYALLYAPGGLTTNRRWNPDSVLIGDTVTGKTLATLAPATGTSFAAITAAADDRTFVVATSAGRRRPA